MIYFQFQSHMHCLNFFSFRFWKFSSLTYLQEVSYFSKKKMTILQTMATYATLWTISDSVEQKFISKKEQMDYKKSVRMVTVGTFVVAPLVFTWMFLAERMFPGRAIKTVAKKMITDQVVFAPVAISTFYFSKLFIQYCEWSFPSEMHLQILSHCRCLTFQFKGLLCHQM